MTGYGRERHLELAEFQEHIRQAQAEGKLEDHTNVEHSKLINFFLDYKSEHGPFLDPFFDRIIKEIELSEYNLPESPRLKRRPHDVNKRFREAVRVLILNLELISKNLFLAVSKDANTYGLDKRYAPPDMTYEPFIQAYDGLKRLGYLHVQHNGFYDEDGGMRTRICATDKLTQAYEAFRAGRDLTFINNYGRRRSELIILKDEDGLKTDYKDNSFTTQARKRLRKINKVLAAHEYELPLHDDGRRDLAKKVMASHNESPDKVLPYIDFQSVRLFRVFSEGSFERGGRFYGGWWQNVPQAYRKRITIDGQKTAELDYSRYHISMMYAELGLALDFDAYKIHPNVSVEITKETVNALISARGIPGKPSGFHEEDTGIGWQEFIELIKDKHAPLVEADMLMKGYGLTLQFQDAELAEDIMLHFIEQDIPCLPIHDSFIVAEQYKDELEDTMKSIYYDNYGQDIGVGEK